MRRGQLDAGVLLCPMDREMDSAVMGGLDDVVFSGGIGENAAPIRAHTLEGLDFLGLALDDAANDANATRIGAGTDRGSGDPHRQGTRDRLRRRRKHGMKKGNADAVL